MTYQAVQGHTLFRSLTLGFVLLGSHSLATPCNTATHVTITLIDDHGKFCVGYDLSANHHHWCHLSTNRNY
uniref:Putative secreted protein n=1 Tax=Ixodes ricinus TaxID=34613 RepID=A0A6B0U2F1_IXORI